MMLIILFEFYSPLEQFEIYRTLDLWTCPVHPLAPNISLIEAVLYDVFFHVYYPIGKLIARSDIVLVFSNSFLTVLFILLFFFFLTLSGFYQYSLVGHRFVRLHYRITKIVLNIIRELFVHRASLNYYIGFFGFVFFLIVVINVLGLIPYTFVLTSQFFFTFGLAFLFFITLNITGIVKHGSNFFNLFYPSGTPIFIVPLLVLIELVSYIARVFSLAIRLFANITAGHILVKILSWLTWMVLDFVILSGLSFVIISGLWVLEFFISLLQAYVFLTLLCLYLNDVLVLH